MMERLRRNGVMPARLLLSPTAFRDLRDEGHASTDGTTLFGLVAEVGMGWTGECYAVVTHEAVSLSEMMTAQYP